MPNADRQLSDLLSEICSLDGWGPDYLQVVEHLGYLLHELGHDDLFDTCVQFSIGMEIGLEL